MDTQWIVYRLQDSRMEIKVFNSYEQFKEFEDFEKTEFYTNYFGGDEYKPWKFLSQVEIKLHDKVTFNRDVFDKVDGYVYKNETHSLHSTKKSENKLETAKNIMIKALSDLKEIGYELNSNGFDWSLEDDEEVYITKNKFGTEVE